MVIRIHPLVLVTPGAQRAWWRKGEPDHGSIDSHGVASGPNQGASSKVSVRGPKAVGRSLLWDDLGHTADGDHEGRRHPAVLWYTTDPTGLPRCAPEGISLLHAHAQFPRDAVYSWSLA
jgi:hypothetical protein